MNSEQQATPKRTGRSIGAVAAGFLAVVVLSMGMDAVMHATGIFAPAGHPMATGLWALATGYRALFQVAGGYITARLAPDRPLWHAWILIAIGCTLGLIGVIATWHMGPEFGPKWYPISIVVLAIPTTWIGAKLFRRTR